MFFILIIFIIWGKIIYKYEYVDILFILYVKILFKGMNGFVEIDQYPLKIESVLSIVAQKERFLAVPYLLTNNEQALPS